MKIPNKRELQQAASNNSSDIDFKDFMKLYKDYTKEPYSFSVDRQTAEISALSSRNASKYEFLTGKNVLPEKDLLEKAATTK